MVVLKSPFSVPDYVYYTFSLRLLSITFTRFLCCYSLLFLQFAITFQCDPHVAPSFPSPPTKKEHRKQTLAVLLILRRLASIKFLVKCFYSTSSSMYTLFSAVERMALRADFYFNIMFCSRSGFKFVTASADNFYSFILWVNTFFHLLHLFLLKLPKLHITFV